MKVRDMPDFEMQESESERDIPDSEMQDIPDYLNQYKKVKVKFMEVDEGCPPRQSKKCQKQKLKWTVKVKVKHTQIVDIQIRPNWMKCKKVKHTEIVGKYGWWQI